METLPTELLEAPQLALCEEWIKVCVGEERRLRHKSRDESSAVLKAEFING